MSAPSGPPSLIPRSPGPDTTRLSPASQNSHPRRDGPLPEGQRVLPLDLAGGISDQEGAIRCVPEFLIHLLPRGTPRIGAALDLPFRPCPPHGPTPQPYLEMSPQYHSASCREDGLPPLTSPPGAGFALGGLGGSAGGQKNKCTLSTNSLLWSAPIVTEPADTGGTQSQHLQPSNNEKIILQRRGVTWGCNLLLLQVLLKQLLHQQSWEVGGKLSPGEGNAVSAG